MVEIDKERPRGPKDPVRRRGEEVNVQHVIQHIRVHRPKRMVLELDKLVGIAIQNIRVLFTWSHVESDGETDFRQLLKRSHLSAKPRADDKHGGCVEKVGSQVCVALHGLQYMTNTRSRSHFACKVRLTPCSIVLQTRHSLCSEADGMRRPDARSCAPWSSPLGRLLHTLRGHIPPLSISQSAAYLVVKIFCELGLPGSNAKNSSGRPYRYLPSCMPDFHERLPRLLSFFCVRETNFTMSDLKPAVSFGRKGIPGRVASLKKQFVEKVPKFDKEPPTKINSPQTNNLPSSTFRSVPSPPTRSARMINKSLEYSLSTESLTLTPVQIKTTCLWKLLHAIFFLTGGITFIFGSACYFFPDWPESFLIGGVLYTIGSCGFLGVNVMELFTFTSDRFLSLNNFMSATGSFLYVVGSIGYIPAVYESTTNWNIIKFNLTTVGGPAFMGFTPATTGAYGFIAGSFLIGCSQLWKVWRIMTTTKEMIALGVELSTCLGAWCFLVGTSMYYNEYLLEAPSAYIVNIWEAGSVLFTIGALFVTYRHCVQTAPVAVRQALPSSADKEMI